MKLPDEILKPLWKQVEQARKGLAFQYKRRWDRNLLLYQGDHWFDEDDDDPILPNGLKATTINWIGAGIKIKHSSDTAVVPQFDVMPEDPTIDQGELNLRLVIAAYINKNFCGASGFWDAAQAAWLDYHVYGTGVVAVGWRMGIAEPAPIDDASLQEQAEHEAGLQEMYLHVASNPAFAGASFSPPETSEEVPLRGEGQVGFRVSPYNLIIDPEATWDTWQQARFIGYTYQRTLDDLEAAYGEAAVDGISGYTETVDDGTRRFVLDPADEERTLPEGQNLVPCAEVWFRSVHISKAFTSLDGDIERTYPAGDYPIRFRWAIERPNEPLEADLWPYDLRDDDDRRLYPFHIVVNREMPGYLFGQGDPEIAQDPQHALNLERSLELTHHNQVREKYIAQEGELDVDARDAIESEDVGTVVFTKSPAASNPIRPLERNSLTPEFQEAAAQAKEDINSLTGVNDAARGTPIPGDHTATEARLEAQLSSGRSAKAASKFEDLCVWLASMGWQLKCQYASAGDRVRFRAPRPQGGAPTMQLRLLTGEQLVPVSVTLTTGATRVQDEAQKLERTIQFIQIVGSMGQFKTPLTPFGVVSPTHTVQLLARSCKLDQDLDSLFDTSAEDQQIQQQQQAQMQAQAQMAQMAPPGGSPGGPPLPPGGGPPNPSLASFPGQPLAAPVAPSLADMIANGRAPG